MKLKSDRQKQAIYLKQGENGEYPRVPESMDCDWGYEYENPRAVPTEMNKSICFLQKRPLWNLSIGKPVTSTSNIYSLKCFIIMARPFS